LPITAALITTTDPTVEDSRRARVEANWDGYHSEWRVHSDLPPPKDLEVTAMTGWKLMNAVIGTAQDIREHVANQLGTAEEKKARVDALQGSVDEFKHKLEVLLAQRKIELFEKMWQDCTEYNKYKSLRDFWKTKPETIAGIEVKSIDVGKTVEAVTNEGSKMQKKIVKEMELTFHDWLKPRGKLKPQIDNAQIIAITHQNIILSVEDGIKRVAGSCTTAKGYKPIKYRKRLMEFDEKLATNLLERLGLETRDL
jgi:hypothetical protein